MARIPLLMVVSQGGLNSEMQITINLSKLVLKLAAFILVLFALAAVGRAEDIRFVPGQILVKPRASMTEADFTGVLKAHGGVQKSAIRDINVRVVGVPAEKVDAVLAALQRNPQIEFAEPDFIAKAIYAPNDPYYAAGYQWHHTKMQTPQAWDVTQGRTNLIIAVLDSGIDPSHPDLAKKLVPGWNYISNNSNWADDHGHGTAVAGSVGALGNNGIGVAGVALNNNILPIKVLDASGSGPYSAIANGINYAANKGARIINLSLGAPTSSSTLQSAIDYAWSKNAVIIAAAGNSGNNTLHYPAACRNVVAVSATTSSDNLASFSTYGSFVAVSAPGQEIWTTSAGGGYGGWSGTSFASPVAAGVAALVASANSQLSNQQIVDVLKKSTDDLGPAGYDVYFGHGRLNTAKAVAAATPVVSDSIAPTVAINSPGAGATVSGSTTVTVSATDNVGVARTELYLDGTLVGSAPGATFNFAWDTTTRADGNVTFQARAYDAAGNVGISTSVTVTVRNTVVADTTPPTVQITSPATGTTVLKSVKIYVAAQDNVGVARVELFIDGKFFSSSTSASPVFTWNTFKIARGQHTIEAVAYDVAGNRAVSPMVTVIR